MLSTEINRRTAKKRDEETVRASGRSFLQPSIDSILRNLQKFLKITIHIDFRISPRINFTLVYHCCASKSNFFPTFRQLCS